MMRSSLIKRRRVAGALLCLLALPGRPQGAARDVYVIDHNFSRPDSRDRYTLLLLNAALEASSARYGAYELRRSPLGMERDRLLSEMKKGELVNLSAQITSQEWERGLIPIRIPVDKGISGYRISLITGSKQAQFSAITTLEQLKRLPLGAGRQWSSTAVFLHAGFDVAQGNSTAGLHSMLAAHRFEHFPRGIEEALFEQAAYAPTFPGLEVERSLAIYFPLPRYFFVTPGQPRLAERLEYGLRQLIADGRFDQIFHDFYDELIDKINLRKRRVFRLDNPLLSPQTPLANKAYWYDPFDHK
ncbi:hypothetical protein [Duganella radicis]|uniref:hypothetical protein n=1 Tax=Duganella radicis TaxID=551988 RepID=UPI001E651246|nr:hypothetical protein [Duganella radicis]